MKTAEEIKGAITRIRGSRDGYKSVGDKAFAEICRAQIRSLRWALGYKTGKWFWCCKCQRQHENERCLICGDATVVKPNTLIEKG